MFDYSLDKISSDVGCSTNTSRSYLKRFKERGWVRDHSGNLMFVAPRKFNDNIKNARLIKFKVEGDVKKIQDDLYLLFLKHKQSQFDRVKRLAREIKTPTNSREHKAALRMTKKNNYSVDNLPDQNAKFRVSIKTIADWFNCSVGKACQIINRLKLHGLIRVEKSYQVLTRMRDKKIVAAFLNANPGSYFNGKCVIRVACNQYQF